MSPQHNRSSLREGPLADLVRRTDAPADAIADGTTIPTAANTLVT